MAAVLSAEITAVEYFVVGVGGALCPLPADAVSHSRSCHRGHGQPGPSPWAPAAPCPGRNISDSLVSTLVCNTVFISLAGEFFRLSQGALREVGFAMRTPPHS